MPALRAHQTVLFRPTALAAAHMKQQDCHPTPATPSQWTVSFHWLMETASIRDAVLIQQQPKQVFCLNNVCRMSVCFISTFKCSPSPPPPPHTHTHAVVKCPECLPCDDSASQGMYNKLSTSHQTRGDKRYHDDVVRDSLLYI